MKSHVRILKQILDLKHVYQTRLKNQKKYSPEQDEEYSTSLERTFNIADDDWENTINADIFLTEAQKLEKIRILSDYIGDTPTR